MDLTSHLDRLVATLDPRKRGHVGPAIADAVRAVPRDQFIPDLGIIRDDAGEPRLIDRHADPDAWYRAVYGGKSIVTQLDDGATPLTELRGDFTSSASEPGTVADFLHHLAVEDGMRVLEIGTGTGYTAALLCHLVGAHGSVTSVEVDAGVAEQAARNLAAVGVRPRLVVGDGAAGVPGRAPYDRVHVTCGIRHVPYAWVEQCRPGALIVAPWRPGFGIGFCLRLQVQQDRTARGGIVDFAEYMWMRSQRPATDEAPPGDERRQYWTALDPRAFDQLDAGVDLTVSALTGAVTTTGSGSDEEGDWWRMWLSDPDVPGSWAAVTCRPGSRIAVQQAGERPLWDEVLRAYARWVDLGEPSWRDFGVTVGPQGTNVWIRSPDNPL
ncbi:Protein-L-isoaspartate O-methyltransferase [Nonomuraea coxensis DSM 45129]|uniref:Protein-L-isoaspartate O-methyltransferase n=1 Tax=Nonomuraea coxensis DSM 45129 TaxID=1122611 RepID=A0ABX8UDM7_9ACTN|nr:methyltransferase domain-containing protein [Nonomuraea coxensis]QYC45902.1 Protein-L-isoaspartate O-methyltransferase [Nonomuraea coxensis DSM 45129]